MQLPRVHELTHSCEGYENVSFSLINLELTISTPKVVGYTRELTS